MRLALCAAVMLCAGCVPEHHEPDGESGESSVPDSEAQPLDPTGRLTGFLYVDPISDEVVVDAVPGTDPARRPAHRAALRSDTGALAISGPSGEFAFPALPAGRRTIQVDLEGLFDTPPVLEWQVQIQAGRTSSGRRSPRQAAGSTGAAMGWAYPDSLGRLVLAPARRTDRRPLANAVLWFGETEVQTDADGFYLVTGLPTGECDVTSAGAGGSCRVTILGGMTAAGADASPDEWGAAAGAVGLAHDAPEPYFAIAPSRQTVQPIPGAVVALATGQTALTDVNGAYVFYGVEPGLHTLSATARGTGGAAKVIIVLPGVVTRGSEAPPGSVRAVTLGLSPAGRPLAVGRTIQLQAVALGAGQAPIEGFDTFRWSVSDIRVARVSHRGEVTGLSEGSVAVTAEAGGARATIGLLVGPPDSGIPASLTLRVLGPPVIPVGRTSELRAEVRDAQGSVLAGYPVAFSTSDETVATVSRTGIVSGLSEGTCTITARAGEASDSLAIEVVRADQRLEVTPVALAFAGTEERYVTVHDRAEGAGGLMQWTAAVTAPWLEVVPVGGWGDAVVAVRVYADDLAPGVYTDTIAFDAGSYGQQNVFVTVNVQDVVIIIE